MRARSASPRPACTRCNRRPAFRPTRSGMLWRPRPRATPQSPSPRPSWPATWAVLDRLIGLFDLLAVLAVVIGGLGIVNTLAVGVLERGREIAILRSHGMTVGQVQAMVVTEAGIIGAVGGLAAVVMVGGGLITITVAAPGDFAGGIAVPWALLAAVVLLGIGVASVAGIYPARTAARASITDSLKHFEQGGHPRETASGRRAGRAFVGRLAPGTDLVAEIERFCADNDIRSAWVSVVGAVSHAAFGYYEQDERRSSCRATTTTRSPASPATSLRDGKPFPHRPRRLRQPRRRIGGRHVPPGCTASWARSPSAR